MRAWSLVSVRNPIWRRLGLGILILATAGTGLLIHRGPRTLAPAPKGHLPEKVTVGRLGTYTERLGESRFLLAYEAISGGEATLHLRGVLGRLEESEALWLMKSPSARKDAGVWFLDGPMSMEARDPTQQTLLGLGDIESPGPGLRWDHGVWIGMSTLLWEDLQGRGKGRWTLPPGWRRELDHRFVVKDKGVHWEATSEGALRSFDARSLWVTLGFRNGRMEQVRARVEGGWIQATALEMDPERFRWEGPMHFQRDDGWNGNAASGAAPRPDDNGPIRMIDMDDFQARRAIPEGTESIRSNGARWTKAGILAEGDVTWEQPRNGDLLTLRAPRVLFREGPGDDLPADLPSGDARAEGTAVITWGNRSLSSPQMDVRTSNRSWRILGPTYGRGEQGTFSAGAGRGTPLRWEFEGPIRATALQGGNLRADRLVWEESTWTATGRPVTWNGLRERLSGPKLVWKGDAILFPDGIGGAFAAHAGDVVIRADSGGSQSGKTTFTGRVDCKGQEWHLQADRVAIQLGANNHVKTVTAQGAVLLQGRISEGRGEYLELDLDNRTARWQGRVKGLTEVQP